MLRQHRGLGALVEHRGQLRDGNAGFDHHGQVVRQPLDDPAHLGRQHHDIGVDRMAVALVGAAPPDENRKAAAGRDGEDGRRLLDGAGGDHVPDRWEPVREWIRGRVEIRGERPVCWVGHGIAPAAT